MNVVSAAQEVSKSDVQPRPAASLSVTVVICTNRPSGLAAAVGSVLANDWPPFDLIVVAQGPDPAPAHEALAEYLDDPRLRVVHDSGRGLSRARNIGIRAATGEIVLFTDDDCVVAPNWVAAHVACYQEHPEAMLIYGPVVPPADYTGLNGFVPSFDPAQDQPMPHLGVVIGMGANMSHRRSLIDRIGPFDEELGAGGSLMSGEDMDISFRARAAGLVALADDRAPVIHAGGVRGLGEESRTLWRRDGVGGGALLAKLVRMGEWRVVRASLYGMGELWCVVLANMARGRRPFGLSRIGMRTVGTLDGFVRGMRQPLRLDPSGYLFTPRR